jgi:hypothetical protein
MITRDDSKYLPQMGLTPKRACSDGTANLGLPLTDFSAGLLSKPQRLNRFDSMENYDEEVHTLKCICNSGDIAWNLGNGAASDLGTGILRAVLSQRELSE